MVALPIQLEYGEMFLYILKGVWFPSSAREGCRTECRIRTAERGRGRWRLWESTG